MPPTMQSLGIDQLPREDRLSLVMDIWDTIAVEAHPSLLSEEQRKELDRRVAEDDATPEDVVPREQVKAQALARLKKK